MARRLQLLGGKITPILVFMRLFVFEMSVRAGQTDGRTDGQAP